MLQRTIMLPSNNLQLSIVVAALGSLAMVLPGAADTFVLKDGSKLEGVILHQDATSYTLEVQVTKSIKDERVVAKANVVNIERTDPGQVAFVALRQLTPTPDGLTAAQYAPMIRTVEKFLRDYPTSANMAAARAILATLKAEANEVLSGGVKLNGKMVPSEVRTANRYEIDAQVQKLQVLNRIHEANVLQALREFAEMDQDFRNTTVYAGLVPQIQQLITSYLAEVEQSVASLDARIKARELGLERMPAVAHRETENAIQQENAALEARFKKESDAKIGWVTTHPFFKPSLDATVTFAKAELVRLAATKNPPDVDCGKIFRETWALIQEHGDPAAVTTALAAAKTALLPPRYLAILEAAAAGKVAP